MKALLSVISFVSLWQTGLCGADCNIAAPYYTVTGTVPHDSPKQVFYSTVSCAEGYIGTLAPFDYTCDDGDIDPPLDGCGKCLRYSQPGYVLKDIVMATDVQHAFLENEELLPGDVECEQGGARGYVEVAGGIKHGPKCRVNPTTGVGYWSGEFEGCRPACPAPASKGAVFRGAFATAATPPLDATAYAAIYHSTSAIAAADQLCANGWVPTPLGARVAINIKCGARVDFAWHITSPTNAVSWCTYPNVGTWWDTRGYPKRGYRTCPPYQPPTEGGAFDFTDATVKAKNFEVAHKHAYEGSAFTCGGGVGGSPVGRVECVDGEWQGRISGCVKTTCDPYVTDARIPRGYLVSAMATTVTVTTCAAMYTDTTGTPAGQLSCVDGIWKVTTPFSGCFQRICLFTDFGSDFPGYTLTPFNVGADELRNGDHLDSSPTVSGLPTLGCHSMYLPDGEMTSLSQLVCLAGRFKSMDRDMVRGCKAKAPVPAPPPATKCLIQELPTVPPGYVINPKPDGTVDTVRCADGWLGTPTWPTCEATNKWSTTTFFGGCVKQRCDGELLQCESGECRDPDGFVCTWWSPVARCCILLPFSSVKTVLLRNVYADAMNLGDIPGGFGRQTIFTSPTQFFTLHAFNLGTQGDDERNFHPIHKYSVGGREGVVALAGAPTHYASSFETSLPVGGGGVTGLNFAVTQNVPFVVDMQLGIHKPILGSVHTPLSGFTMTLVAADAEMVAVAGGHTAGTTGVHGLGLTILRKVSGTWMLFVEDGYSNVGTNPSGKAILNAATLPYVTLKVRTPYVFFADGTAAHASDADFGMVYYWDFDETSAGGPLPSVHKLVDFTAVPFDAFSTPTKVPIRFGAAMDVNGDLLVVSAPWFPSCFRGVQGGMTDEFGAFERRLYGFGALLCKKSGAVFVFRHNRIRRSWANIEAVIHPPMEVGLGAPTTGALDANIYMGDESGHVAVSSADTGAIFVTASVIAPSGVSRSGAIARQPIADARSVLAYRRRYAAPEDPARRAQLEWYHSQTIGYKEFRYEMDPETEFAYNPTSGPVGTGFGGGLATWDGRQLVIGAPSLAHTVVSGDTAGLSYSPVKGDATKKAHGAAFYYSPLVPPAKTCDRVPLSLLVGVTPPYSAGYLAKCGAGSADGDSCDGWTGGFQCDHVAGYCGRPSGSIGCSNGEWVGMLRCERCRCSRPPSLAGHEGRVQFANDCTNVTWQKPCIVRCAEGICGQPSNNFFWCSDTEPIGDVYVGKYLMPGPALDSTTCEACETASCKNQVVADAINTYYPGALVTLGYTKDTGSMSLPCDRSAGSCSSVAGVSMTCSGSTWPTVTATDCDAMKNCATCDNTDAVDAIQDSTPAKLGGIAALYTLPSGLTDVYTTVQFRCATGKCAMEGATSGAVRCLPGASASAWSLVAAPTHCRDCWSCLGQPLNELYPQYIFQKASDSSFLGDDDFVPHGSEAQIGFCRPPFLSGGAAPTGGDVRFKCTDGAWSYTGTAANLIGCERDT